MGLILAPYNNAMRLGQGFNSYTQEICIDDAVIVDPRRPENSLTNDGTTMGDLRAMMQGPDAYISLHNMKMDQAAHAGTVSIPGEDSTRRPKLPSKPKPKPIEQPQSGNTRSGSTVESDGEESIVLSDTDDDTVAEPKPKPKPNSESSPIPGSPITGSPVPGKADSKVGKNVPVVESDIELESSDDEEVPASGSATTKPSTTKSVVSLVKNAKATKGTGNESDIETKPSKPTKKYDISDVSDASDDEVLSEVASDDEDDARSKRGSPAGSDVESEIGENPRKPSTGGTRASQKQQAMKRLHEQEDKQKAQDTKDKLAREARDTESEKTRLGKREEAEKEEKERRKEAEHRAKDASKLEPYTKAELQQWLGKDIKEKSKEAAAAVGSKTRGYTYKVAGRRGPSQIVTYSSRFVEKLSDITDDMNISGALSIRYGTIGGSGRGAFVNSDKFHESDLNFYISVKVINQTTNLKDALVYQPLASVDGENFREVYGDTFISGFLEGGEFNALVSMKVLNEAKMTDIKAEAKVALTVGAAEVNAQAAVKIAKSNLKSNTETTIQVSWSGGGFIKPIDEPWDIESLTGAAARFADLVAVTPQRTYAILTKYESLRSFVMLQPAKYSSIQYESAQLYTSMLMDTYMDYKTILKKLSSDIFDVENNISEIKEKERPGQRNSNTGRDVYTGDPFDETPFRASLAGLDQARRGCRFQMIRIVNEVDHITKFPREATQESRVEPFQPPRVFKDRLPLVIPRFAAPTVPLSGEDIEPGSGKRYGALSKDMEQLEDQERLAITELVLEKPSLGRFFQLAKPVGSNNHGTPFNSLDFLRHSIHLTSVSVGIFHDVIMSIKMTYSNGLQCVHGVEMDQAVKAQLFGLGEKERLIGCSVETGEEVKAGSSSGSGSANPSPGQLEKPKPDSRIVRLKLYTNRGRSLVAQAGTIDEANLKRQDKRGDREFKNLDTTHFDPVPDKPYIKGFWGYAEAANFGATTDGLWRLGVIWGNDLKPEIPPAGSKTKKQAEKGKGGDGSDDEGTKKGSGKKPSGKAKK